MAPNEEPEKDAPRIPRRPQAVDCSKKESPEGQITILSMGMTNDFEIAIEEGNNGAYGAPLYSEPGNTN